MYLEECHHFWFWWGEGREGIKEIQGSARLHFEHLCNLLWAAWFLAAHVSWAFPVIRGLKSAASPRPPQFDPFDSLKWHHFLTAQWWYFMQTCSSVIGPAKVGNNGKSPSCKTWKIADSRCELQLQICKLCHAFNHSLWCKGSRHSGLAYTRKGFHIAIPANPPRVDSAYTGKSTFLLV